MRRVLIGVAICLFGTPAFGQRPSDPSLLLPERAPLLDYVAVADPVRLSAGTEMGAPAAVSFDSKGHLYVLTRGPKTFLEFDPNGTFVRGFGDALFTRSHGLHIARDGNIWATDVGAHVVVQFSPIGEVLLTLGTKGEAGEWNEATGSRKLNQPTGVAVAPNGDVFVSQGHTPGTGGNPRVLKFDGNGRFITSWGGKGTGPGQFDVAHGVAVDAQGMVWVMDRENQRIQIFGSNGTFVRQVKYSGLPCSIDIGSQYIYMVNGYAGQVVQLDLSGKVLAAVGKPGTGLGEFGEAHSIAVSPRGELYVADSANSALIKFVKR